MPAAMTDAVAGVPFAASGAVLIGGHVARVDTAWEHGVAAPARAGAGPAGPITPAARRTGRCGPRGRSGRP